MATISGYIQSTLKRLKVFLSDSELETIMIDYGFEEGALYNAESARAAKIAILGIIPELLAAPDISEGDFSIKYNRDSLIAYCGFLSKQLGVADPFYEKSDNDIDVVNLW